METFPVHLRARLTSYRYRGQHRHWNPTTGRIEPGHQHWDWRYVITVNGVTLLYRQGFCTRERAQRSLEASWARVRAALDARGTGRA